MPSGRTAPRTSLPSQAACGSSAGAARGKVTGRHRSAAASQAATARDRARGLTRARRRVTVLPHGAARVPSGPVRAPRAARVSWPAWVIQAVTSASFVLPCSIAVTVRASTQGSE